MERKNSIIGRKYGKLTVVQYFKGAYPRYLCKCDCGKETNVAYANLYNGKTNACRGCSRKANMGRRYTLTILKRIQADDMQESGE